MSYMMFTLRHNKKFFNFGDHWVGIYELGAKHIYFTKLTLIKLQEFQEFHVTSRAKGSKF